MQRFYGIVVPKLLVLATRKSLPNAPATFIIAVLIGKLAIPSKSIGCRFHRIPQAIVICDRCDGLVASGIKYLLLKKVILGRGLCLVFDSKLMSRILSFSSLSIILMRLLSFPTKNTSFSCPRYLELEKSHSCSEKLELCGTVAVIKS